MPKSQKTVRPRTRRSPKESLFPAPLPVAVRLPHGFLEGIFGGFEVMRFEGEERCVRYAVGDEERAAFLPFYDHRPGVLAAARAFEEAPLPDRALELVARLGDDADLEVRTRRVGKRDVLFAKLLPPSGSAQWALRGEDRSLAPEALGQGLAFPGGPTRWYWTGVVPTGAGGLRLVHLVLEPIES